MNADRLLALYDRVADAPDAVVRLRRFVLDLAVRGKLVQQDPADKPASELSELIAREGINDLGLLGNWCRVTVGNALDFRYGKGLKASDRADDGPVPVYGSNGIIGYTTEPLTVRPSVIVGRKGSAGGLNKNNGPSWTTDVAYYVETPDFFDLDFLFFSLATLDLSDLAKGVKPGLSRADAYSKVISVPPLAEQHRIVVRVNDLMALCDWLEETRTVREDTRDRLTKASLVRLSAADTDVPTFRSHARFAVDALPALTARADQVKHLRQTILSLAVRGKLVEQDPADEPASELLKRIAVEKALLLKARKIRRRRRTKSLSPTEPVFGLPRGWADARLSEVLIELQTGPFGSSLHQSDYRTGGTPVVNPASIRNGKIVPVGKMAVGKDTLERLATFKIRAGDIVMGRRGEMGRCAVVGECEDGWLCGTGSLILRLSDSVCSDYLAMLIGSPDVRAYLQGSSVGTTMRNLNQSILLAMSMGLPPLAEQRRIVAKVDELMTLCDELEAGLDAAGGTRSLLLDSLLHESLGSHVAVINGKTGGVTRIGT